MEALGNAWYSSCRTLNNLTQTFQACHLCTFMWPPFFSGAIPTYDVLPYAMIPYAMIPYPMILLHFQRFIINCMLISYIIDMVIGCKYMWLLRAFGAFLWSLANKLLPNSFRLLHSFLLWLFVHLKPRDVQMRSLRYWSKAHKSYATRSSPPPPPIRLPQ